MKLALDLGALETEVAPSIAGKGIGDIVTDLLPFILAGAGIVLLLLFLFGGIELMTSGGDSKKAQAAQGKLTSALVGFIIVFVAYWLVQIVGEILDIQAIRDVFQ